MGENEKKVVFFGGKGGVGKSTVSAAYALQSANSGRNTLLVSTDPAHNTGDIFGVDIGGTIQQVRPRLAACEIDSEKESKHYLAGVKENLRNLVKPSMKQEVFRQIDMAGSAPGADEAALFDRIVSLILDESVNYDRLVFDTAPTGHTIRLLTLPELMGVWIEGMLQRRRKFQNDYSRWLGDGEAPDDPVYDLLNRRKERFRRVREILLDDGQTGFVFVLNPERLPIMETKKAVHQLSHHDLRVHTLVVNKVLPDEVDGTFFRKRKQREQEYLEMITEWFGDQQVIHIPLLEEDIHDFDALNEVSKFLSHVTV
ncbi:MAG TPA: ArsA family ATPase [Bacillales bacterium]|nr:ArsA family ATPase [Bacillales bacterium]